MVVCPVAVEFLWCDTFLAVVKQFDMIHPFEVHGASRFVGKSAAVLDGGDVVIGVVGFRGAIRGGEGEEKEKTANLHVDCRMIKILKGF